MHRARALLALLTGVALLVPACGGDDGGSADEAPGSTAATTTTEPTYAGLAPADLTFNPVLAIVGCEGGGIPGEAAETTTEATPSTTVAAIAGDVCYILGPAGGDGTDLRDAKVYADGVGIEVAVREDSVATLNTMFDACYEAAATCPASSTEGRGYVAVVVDGRVISTPAINEPLLASTPFVITGDFDTSQATNIATAINGY